MPDARVTTVYVQQEQGKARKPRRTPVPQAPVHPLLNDARAAAALKARVAAKRARRKKPEEKRP